MIKNNHNNIIIGKNCFIENETIFDEIKPTIKIKIGNNVKIYAYTKFILGENAQISIGDNTIIAGAILTVQKGVKIGKNVIISYYVSIMDSDLHSTNSKIRKKEVYEYAPPTNHEYRSEDIVHDMVMIDNDVLIGANAIILKGVHIGKNAEVAAGSVVAKNIPENSYAEGNPVKIYSKNESGKK